MGNFLIVTLLIFAGLLWLLTTRAAINIIGAIFVAGLLAVMFGPVILGVLGLSALLALVLA